MKRQLFRGGRNMTWALALATFSTFSFVSCSSDDDDVIDPETSLKVVHAVPNGAAVNFFLDGTKQNASAISFGQATGYIATSSGRKTAELKTATGDNTILSASIDLNDGNHTLFATGMVSDNTVTAIVAEDNLQTPAAGKARVRVAHLSPDAPSVNVSVNDSLVLSGATYKQVSGFLEIPARTYVVKIAANSNGQTVYTRENVVLEAGKNYTLVAQGLLNGGLLDEDFSVNVITY